MIYFQRIEKEDEGEYVCTVTSEAGTDRVTAVIVVKNGKRYFVNFIVANIFKDKSPSVKV